MSSTSEVKNLEVIAKAIDQHNTNCNGAAVKILMNPFEVTRLDWDEIRGLPIEPDPEISTGRFHIVCANEINKHEESESTNADINEIIEDQRERELVPV